MNDVFMLFSGLEMLPPVKKRLVLALRLLTFLSHFKNHQNQNAQKATKRKQRIEGKARMKIFVNFVC